MTEHSAHRHAAHAAHVRGLYEMAAFIESDATVPTPDHLASVTSIATPADLVTVAVNLDLPGPFQAPDGSYFLHRAFAGGVSTQWVSYADRTGASSDEQQARAWCALHGFVPVPYTHIVPITDATSGA